MPEGLFAVRSSTTSRAVPESRLHVIYAPSKRRAQKVARLNGMGVVYEHETDTDENCVTKYGEWK